MTDFFHELQQYHPANGSVTSAAKMPGSFARLRKPSYFSTTALTRFMPKPWLPRFWVM